MFQVQGDPNLVIQQSQPETNKKGQIEIRTPRTPFEKNI